MKLLFATLLVAILGTHVFAAFTPVDTEKFTKQALKAHNTYRAKHKAPALELNDKLSIMAQAIANLRVTDESYIASLPRLNNETVGSNVCQTIDNAPDIIGDGEHATNSWYSGVTDYKLGLRNINSQDFSQLVWKRTRLVGFGFAKSGPHGHYLAVALYYPAGNVEGDYEKNVYLKDD